MDEIGLTSIALDDSPQEACGNVGRRADATRQGLPEHDVPAGHHGQAIPARISPPAEGSP